MPPKAPKDDKVRKHHFRGDNVSSDAYDVDLRVEEQEQVVKGPAADRYDQTATGSCGKEQGVGMSSRF